MKIERPQRYESYNHRLLWTTAEKNLEQAKLSKKDEMYFALGAMFLLFAAFEAYLNWLGTRIASDKWKDERNSFSKPPYKGTLGKYLFLSERLKLPIPDASQGSFLTAIELHSMRNMVAHSKTEVGEKLVEFSEENFPPIYENELEKKISLEKAIRSKQHIEELVEELHHAAKQAYPDSIDVLKAFGAGLGHDETDI